MFERRSLRLLLVAGFLSLTPSVATAGTDVTCTYDDVDVVQLTIHADANRPRLFVSDAGLIRYKLGNQQARTCSGASENATVHNTDLIFISDLSDGGEELNLDMRNKFRPGQEPEDSRPEIEIHIDMGTGPDIVGIRTGTDSDHILLGARRINYNADDDGDIVYDSVKTWQVETGGGADRVDASGDDTTGRQLDIELMIRAGAGADRLIGGAHGDQISAGNGDDVVFGRDHYDIIWGGYGNDRLFGNGGREYIVGGPGTDVCDDGAGTGFIDCEQRL